MRVSRAQQIVVQTPDATFDLFAQYVREWAPVLALDLWHVLIVRDDTVDECASCIAEVNYNKVRVAANAVRMHRDRYTPLKVESVAVHELVHAMLWLGFNELANPIVPADVASYHEEQTTEHVAASLMRAKYGNDPAVNALWVGCFVETAPASQTGTQEVMPQ